MRFRLGMAVGFGVGYYLGAMAGRERYEQINRMVRKAKGSDTYEMATERARDTMATATEKAKAAADLGAERARDFVESRGGNGTPKVEVPETDPPIRP